MKKRIEHVFRKTCWICALTAAWVIPVTAQAQNEEKVVETRIRSEDDKSSDPDTQKRVERILIQKVDKADAEARENRQVPWLGVATEETSEALAAQLGLKAGEGLTVTFLAKDGPAAKAGLQRNDVLVEFDGQLLVHPEQLRKLIQRHKEGDEVQMAYYRSGKKQTAAATIGKTNRGWGLLGDDQAWRGDFEKLQRQLKDGGSQLQVLRRTLEQNGAQLGEATREQMKALRRTLEQAGVDKESISIEVKRSMEEVRKAIQDALRQATNAHRTFGPAAREFQELARRGLDVEKDATVVVKSKRHSVKSIVKTDDSGTYVVVADPKKQLTAHDKSGKLLFDGPIETSEQQEQVPKEVWEKVQPMIEQLNSDKPDEGKAEEETKGE